jgi:hypothetical protein
MNITNFTSRRERREAAQREQESVSTWHNGRFGVWPWDELAPQEQRDYLEAQKRNQHVNLFGIYA